MKLIVCGDICPAFIEEEFLKQNERELFGEILDEFKNADRVLINLECAVTDKETPIKKKGPNLKISPKCLDLLEKAGITDCGISNNHIFDYGIPGVTDTKNLIISHGMNYTGFGDNYEDSRKNLIMEKDGKTVAVIAVCEHEYCYALENRQGARPFDPFDTLEDVRKAKEECDYVIVTYHGGKEHCFYPSPRLMKASRAMIRAGADVVLCQHSHCIGCYEEYDGGHILYGQGNFHFIDLRNIAEKPHLLNGLMVEIDITDKLDFKLRPVEIKGYGIDFAKGESYDRIMNAFNERNEELKNGKWIEGWDKFCKESVERYIGNISRAYSENATPDDNELFNGRMHCEAHKDVIDWLCKHSWEEREQP